MRALRPLLALFAQLAPELRDVLVFGGLAIAGYGAWQIYPPAAWLAVGVTLFWLGVRKP